MPAKSWLRIALLSSALLSGTYLVSGCTASTSPQATASGTTSPSASSSASATTTQTNAPRLEGKATVEMVVKGETVTIELDGTQAPITAGNFADLVKREVYNGLVFHRVENNPEPFVVQGGDPQSKDPNVPAQLLGTGNFVDPTTKQARYIPLEIKPDKQAAPIYHKTFREAGIQDAPKLRHKRGAIAMARSENPDSASSQFYFALSDLAFLDGNYAVFGYVTQGMETIDKIQVGDRIESIKITQGAGNLKSGPLP